MHDAAFSQAALPAPALILKFPLRPLAVGHWLRLIRVESPFLFGGEKRLEHLVEAVLICSQTWQEFEVSQRDRWLGVKTRLWLRRCRGCRLLEEVAKFSIYLQDGDSMPPCKPTPPGPEDPPSRDSGAPWILRLLQFLMFKVGMTELAALDYPLARAQWHWCAYWESEKSLQIQNRLELHEQIIIDHMAGQPATAERLAEAKKKAREQCPL